MILIIFGCHYSQEAIAVKGLDNDNENSSDGDGNRPADKTQDKRRQRKGRYQKKGNDTRF